MGGINTKVKGRRGEDAACRFLEGRGYKIVCRNFATKFGEIDIIASLPDVLCFIEVKSGSSDFLPPEMKVNFSKRKKILKTAEFYINRVNPPFENFRFDVISITGENIKFYKDAFRGN
ncbi:MAG: YraN family protein [bacterium]